MNIFKTAMVAALTVSGFAMAPAAYAHDHSMGDMHHGHHHARHCTMRHHHRVCR